VCVYECVCVIVPLVFVSLCVWSLSLCVCLISLCSLSLSLSPSSLCTLQANTIAIPMERGEGMITGQDVCQFDDACSIKGEEMNVCLC